MHAPYYTPAGTPMIGELAGYEAHLNRINNQVDVLTAGLTDAQINWRPAPHRWSIGENLDHLTAFNQQCMPAIDDAIGYGRSRSLYAEGPFRYGVVDRLVSWAMEPPVRVRLRTAASLTPAERRSAAASLKAFLATQDEIRARIQQANGLDLATIKVRSPFIRQLALSLGAAFGVLLAHERRHVWQAQRVRATPGFPG
jgi:hypothetical protein